MKKICCLNPNCDNPSLADINKICNNCQEPLIILRNRYRPIKALGGGGFSKTYLAEDIDKLEENCVIKQLAPQTQSTYTLKKAQELFEQEAKQLQKIKHPQIPHLQAYFNEKNSLYLIQEFIDGQNLLEELTKEGSFNEKKIQELLLDILPVLQIVHQQNIIHRDIKPENIMRCGTDGKLFLIDFGASKQIKATMLPGTRIGTFGYASIEQIEDREVYPASDLFSLGTTCFHLITGVHPWELWKTQGYGWVNNWRDHVKQSLSLELGEILDNLLKFNYEDRYQSAQEVLKVLQTPETSNFVPLNPIKPHPKPQSPQLKLQPTNFNRRNFIQYAGLFTGGIIITVVGQNLLGGNKGNKPTPQQMKPFATTRNPEIKPTTTPKNNFNNFSFQTVTTNSQGEIIKWSKKSGKYFTEDLGNGVMLEMVQIPTGKFMMGSRDNEQDIESNEKPQHQVTVPSFCMAKYPVTQAQYQAIVGTSPSRFKGNNRPVENVSWNDAVDFCEKLSQKTGKAYRLPSEAEWEYACRAGTTTPFYFGETITPELVNYNGNYPYAAAPKGQYRGQTTDVGIFHPNAFGLYDMHGNVWEWCLDDWHDNYINAPKNSTPWKSQNSRWKLLRGGSWFYRASYSRCANRFKLSRENSYNHVGFRVVLFYKNK
jgi:formylglycine-generating enzyme required for sulfatase activity/tRNA A-37 threonylcarbamoyl transferase component Bud32